MKIYTTFGQSFPGLVVGIGNFDGVHRGHRRIIECVKKTAGPGGTPGIITFRRHTRLPATECSEHLLTTIRQRLNYFKEAGIAVCWLCDFNRDFSGQTAHEFIDRVLVERLRVKGLCVGEGFRFGNGREGTVMLLEEAGKARGFQVTEVPTVRVGRREVRSSTIRQDISSGKIEAAAELLGHDYSLTGRIIRGRRQGKRLGYPTANFHPEQLLPASGVYAARIETAAGVQPGILYIGASPTFFRPGQVEIIAEAHIFDWSGDLAGKRIKVCLKKQLRGDITFEDEISLSLLIGKDIEEARHFLGSG